MAMSLARMLAVVAAALVFAAPAGATLQEPPAPTRFAGLNAFQLPPAPPVRTTRDCMAHLARVKIARKLVPVACEQPPRSQVLLFALVGG
jgi:hypothetical protein